MFINLTLLVSVELLLCNNKQDKIVTKMFFRIILLPSFIALQANAYCLLPGGNFTNILRAAFCTKVFCAAFMCLQLRFVIFCRKEICAKADHKMLMKLTVGKNPSFKAPPSIHQIDLMTIEISWKGLVVNSECSDQVFNDVTILCN